MSVATYWIQLMSEALDEAGLSATDEQISIVASHAESAHEFYGMAHGHDCIPNPIAMERDKLKEQLQVERRKITCRTCGGRGTITEHFGIGRSSTSQCDNCRGNGRHLP